MDMVRDKPRFIRSIRSSLDRARRQPQIECGQCGESIGIPEWSENLEGERIRHLWTCETSRLFRSRPRSASRRPSGPRYRNRGAGQAHAPSPTTDDRALAALAGS